MTVVVLLGRPYCRGGTSEGADEGELVVAKQTVCEAGAPDQSGHTKGGLISNLVL